MTLITDSSDHGDIRAGWQQQEDATPHVVGDSSGNTRQTSFTADAAATSDLLLGKTITVDGAFDSVGTALDVTLAGDRVSTSTYDIDSLLLPVRDFPSVAAGFEEAALDVLQRMYGSGGVALPWASRGTIHAYYPLRGHDQGFTVDGTNRPYLQETWGRAFDAAGSPVAAYYRGQAACLVNYWERQPSGVVALRATPMYGPVITGNAVNYQAMRCVMTGLATISTKINLAWTSSDPQTNIFIRLSRTSGTGGALTISGSYRQHNAATATTITEVSTSTGDIDMSKPVQLVIQWGWRTTAIDGTLRVKAYAYDPDSPPTAAPPVVVQVDLESAARAELVSNSSETVRTAGGGGFRDMILSQAPSTLAYHYPQIVEPTLITHDFAKNLIGVYPPAGQLAARPPIHAWSGSGWDYLKMLCSARGKAAKIVDGHLHVTDLADASTINRVSGALTAPTLGIRGTGRARSVDVVAHRSEASRSEGTSPSIREDVSIQVRVNTQTEHAISLPAGVYQSGRVEFVINDNDDALISYRRLYNRGARFTARIGRDNILRLTVRGPRDNVGIGEAPWRISEVRVFNVGYLETPETLTLITSAPDSMVTREKAGTVNNPFLSTQGDVYDRGVWAAMAAGEPDMVLSFAVLASRRGEYLPGQLVRYGYGIYRVMEATHTKTSLAVRAVRHTTVAEHDALWAGQTVTKYDEHWGGARCLDAAIRPLQTPHQAAGVDLFPSDDDFPEDDLFPESGPSDDPRPFLRVYPSESKWSDG